MTTAEKWARALSELKDSGEGRTVDEVKHSLALGDKETEADIAAYQALWNAVDAESVRHENPSYWVQEWTFADGSLLEQSMSPKGQCMWRWTRAA